MAKPVHEFETYLHSMELLRGENWRGDEYPFNLAAVRGWDRLLFHPHVTFIVGENGSGKSTLIEAIATAYGLNPEGGSRDHRYATQATHSPLHSHVRLVKSTRRAKDAFFLRAESFYTFSTFADKTGNRSRMGGHALHELSHGQSFTALIENKVRRQRPLHSRRTGSSVITEPAARVSLALARIGRSEIAVYYRNALADHSRVSECDDLRALGFGTASHCV